MSKLNVLVVDDDAINRKLIKALLSKHKDIIANLSEATNGAEALVAIEKDRSINLILLDMIMPVMDGKEFLKVFKSNTENTNKSVIVLTTDDSKKSEALNYGADDVLIKPIKEVELVEHIKYWVRR